MIAALFVEEKGVYAGLPDVDLWGVSRDARTYAGPWPVVAHPPCERWGKFWYGGMHLASKGIRKRLGDDAGCFAAALWAVRTFGGVLEHPEGSRAFGWFGLPVPSRHVTWSPYDRFGGASATVEQGHYGHRARKPTWLYAVGCMPVELHRGRSEASLPIQFMAGKSGERSRTPIPFRDLLLSIARTAGQARAA